MYCSITNSLLVRKVGREASSNHPGPQFCNWIETICLTRKLGVLNSIYIVDSGWASNFSSSLLSSTSSTAILWKLLSTRFYPFLPRLLTTALPWLTLATVVFDRLYLTSLLTFLIITGYWTEYFIIIINKFQIMSFINLKLR